MIGVLLAAAALGCGSGAELYEQDGVRIFETRDRDELPTWWACSARVRTPRRLIGLSPGVTNDLHVRGMQGRRLVFAVESFADGGGGWDAGWFDVRSGATAHAAVDRGSELDFTAGPDGLSVNARGDIGYVLGRLDAEQEEEARRDVAYRPFRGGRFGRERILARLAPAEIEPETLAVERDAVTWRTVGAARSAPLSPAPAAAAAAAPRRRCTAGRTLYHFGARVHTTARGTFACHRGRTARVSRRRVRPRNYVETERFLAFTAAGRLYRFDLATGRIRSGPVSGKVVHVAQGSGHTAAASTTGTIFLLPPSGPVRELAALEPRELEPSTLRLKGGQARWRERGEPRTAPF